MTRMEIIRGPYNLRAEHQGSVATIGNFDGVHLGHQQVLQQLVTQARALNLPAVVITFEPLPQEYFQGDKAPARLLRFREKALLLAAAGVDRILCLRFNTALAQLPASEFVSEILVKNLGIKALIIGDDFHFGRGREGNFALLQQLGKKYNFAVEDTKTVLLQDQRIGSSHVRKALANGQIAQATQLLGRAYRMSGRVIYGDQRGRQLGFPTANLPLKRRVLPLRGVFLVHVYGLSNQPLPAVANIGNRPTVDGVRSLLEIYLLDFNADLYGRLIEVEFLEKLRDEQRFASLDELKTQIAFDVTQAREYYDRLQNHA